MLIDASCRYIHLGKISLIQGDVIAFTDVYKNFLLVGWDVTPFTPEMCCDYKYKKRRRLSLHWKIRKLFDNVP